MGPAPRAGAGAAVRANRLRPNHITTLSLAWEEPRACFFAAARSVPPAGARRSSVLAPSSTMPTASSRASLAAVANRLLPDDVAGALSSRWRCSPGSGSAMPAVPRQLGTGAGPRRLRGRAGRDGIRAGGGRAGGTGDGPYPQWGPFELDDGVYLIGPVTRLGGLASSSCWARWGQIVFSALRLRELWNARPPASPRRWTIRPRESTT